MGGERSICLPFGHDFFIILSLELKQLVLVLDSITADLYIIVVIKIGTYNNNKYKSTLQRAAIILKIVETNVIAATEGYKLYYFRKKGKNSIIIK